MKTVFAVTILLVAVLLPSAEGQEHPSRYSVTTLSTLGGT